MIIGIIALIVIILVIVALIVNGGTSGTDKSVFIAEAKKVHTLLSQLSNESKFYYTANRGSYKDIGMDYFLKHDFAGQNMKVSGNMVKSEWDGWPEGVDGSFPNVYTGPYIQLGGTAGSDMRILASSINDGRAAVFFIVKKNTSDVDIPIEFKIALERALSSDSSYIGG